MTMAREQQKRHRAQLYAQEIAESAIAAYWLDAEGMTTAADFQDRRAAEQLKKLANHLGYDITKREDSELEAAE